jgi:hypothetical protein
MLSRDKNTTHKSCLSVPMFCNLFPLYYPFKLSTLNTISAMDALTVRENVLVLYLNASVFHRTVPLTWSRVWTLIITYSEQCLTGSWPERDWAFLMCLSLNPRLSFPLSSATSRLRQCDLFDWIWTIWYFPTSASFRRVKLVGACGPHRATRRQLGLQHFINSRKYNSIKIPRNCE